MDGNNLLISGSRFHFYLIWQLFIKILLGIWVCLIRLPSASQKILWTEDLVPVSCVALPSFCWHQTNDSHFIPVWNKLVSAQKPQILTVTTKYTSNWQRGKWRVGVSDETNILFKHCLKIIILEYFLSRYSNTITNWSALALPFQCACTLLTCLSFDPVVS